MNIKSFILLALIIAFAPIACNENDVCGDPVSPRIIITVGDQNNVNFPQDSLIISRVVNGEITESFLALNSDSIALQLPFSGTGDQWILGRSLEDGATFDQIDLTYTIDYEFVSIGCGGKAEYRNLSINSTTNDLDSIHLLQNEILNETNTTLRIFYTQ